MALQVSTAVRRPAADVAAFARDERNFPAWAAGLAAGITQRDGRWVADSPMGEVEVRFTSTEFEADAAAVQADLDRLRGLLEPEHPTHSARHDQEAR